MKHKYHKGNPKWVRQGRGNKTHGDFHWEYCKDGEYHAHGFYHTAKEAYEACIKHQAHREMWRNPEKYSGNMINITQVQE